MKLKNGNTRFVLICAGAAVLAIGGFGYFTWTDMERMDELEQDSKALEAKIRKADAEIRTIPGLEDQVLILREQVKEYVTILPDDAEIHAYVDQLTRFETESGVIVTKLDDTQARQRRNARRKSSQAFESISYKLTLKGTTQQLLAFMDMLENDYDRFVRIPSFKIQAFDDRQVQDLEPHEIDRQHSIDLELETYVYNPKKRGHDQVTIPAEPQKLERLREQGKLEALASDVALVRYEIEAKENRRDPFVDPRIVNSRISEEERRAQHEALEDLKSRLGALRAALDVETSEKNLVKRMQMTDRNNEFLAALAGDVNLKATEKYFTVTEFAKEFDGEVLGPVRLLAEERGSGENSDSMPIRDIEQRVADMEKAVASRDWGVVITLHDEIKQLRERFTAPESLRPAFDKADKMFQTASAYRAFEKMELTFGGCVTYEDDPKKAVIIINGRSFGPDEVVADGLTITKITKTEVIFDYKGLEMSRLHVDR